MSQYIHVTQQADHPIHIAASLFEKAFPLCGIFYPIHEGQQVPLNIEYWVFHLMGQVGDELPSNSVLFAEASHFHSSPPNPHGHFHVDPTQLLGILKHVIPVFFRIVQCLVNPGELHVHELLDHGFCNHCCHYT